MAPRFNPRTGEWEGLSDSFSQNRKKTERTPHVPPPAPPKQNSIARLGRWFSGYWDNNVDDNSSYLIFAGLGILLAAAAAINGLLIAVIIIGMLFEKPRTWILAICYFIFLPCAFVLRYIFFNTFTLIFSLCLLAGLLL